MFRFFARLFARLRTRAARLFRPRGVYYINGPDVLPSPLSPEEEAALIARLDDEDAKTALVEHNLRLVAFIAKRFDNTGTGIEDLISIGTLGLMKAINTFRSDKNIKLATYASRCIENEILMYIRKRGSARMEVSLEEPLNMDPDGNELLLSDVLGSDEDSVTYEMEVLEERAAVRSAIASLAPRERELIELRYGFRGGPELTQKEVADRMGISQSYISRLEKRILADLRDRMAGRL